jgi:hypothetical protein
MGSVRLMFLILALAFFGFAIADICVAIFNRESLRSYAGASLSIMAGLCCLFVATYKSKSN